MSTFPGQRGMTEIIYDCNFMPVTCEINPFYVFKYNQNFQVLKNHSKYLYLIVKRLQSQISIDNCLTLTKVASNSKANFIMEMRDLYFIVFYRTRLVR